MTDNSRQLKKINSQAKKKITDRENKEQAELNKETEQKKLF